MFSSANDSQTVALGITQAQMDSAMNQLSPDGKVELLAAMQKYNAGSLLNSKETLLIYRAIQLAKMS